MKNYLDLSEIPEMTETQDLRVLHNQTKIISKILDQKMPNS